MRPFATLTACATLSLAAPALAANFSIMPIGDSITSGYTYTDEDNDNQYVSSQIGPGWRGGLATNLANAGHTVTFLGSQTSSVGNHEGHSGWAIDESTPSGRSGITDNLSNWRSDLGQADVIILGIGVNDVKGGYLNDGTGYDSAIERFAAMLDTLADILLDEGNSTAQVLIANLLPVQPNTNPFGEYPNFSDDAVNNDINTFNAQLLDLFGGWDAGTNDLVATGNPKYANFRLVNAHSAITDTSTMLWQSLTLEGGATRNDYLHPNEVGYAALADFYAARITEVIPEPGTLALLGLGAALACGRRRMAA